EGFAIALFNIPSYTFDWVSWLWLGGAFLFFSSAIVILMWKQVSRAKARVFALQRGLSVGVIRVDTNDEIIGVNDRADFLIADPATELPRLGLRHKSKGTAPEFKQYITNERVL